MNDVIIQKIWEIFSCLHKKSWMKRKNLSFFVNAMTVLLECDKRFSVKNLHYFEDFVIHFNKIAIVENDTLVVCDYYH